MSITTRAQFLRDLGGVAIDPRSPTLQKALEAQGVDPARLASIAGKDGKILGARELDALYTYVDGFDANGSGSSFKRQDELGVATKSGALHDALKSEVGALRAVANASPNVAQLNASLGVATAKNPVIDTHDMSPELGAAFKKAGIADADLRTASGADGRFSSKSDYARLHALLDRADGAADGKATGKTRDAATGVVSENAVGALQSAIAAEATRNAALPQHATPGTRSAPTQSPLTVAGDAMIEDPKDRKPPVSLGVKQINQFSLYPGDPEKGGHACFEAAKKQAEDFNSSKKGVKGTLAGLDETIQLAYAEDEEGRVTVDPKQAKVARDYLDTQLEKGRPVLTGVSYSDDSYNNDKMTDHFITIDGRGHDADGRLFYTYKDPGAGGKYTEGKLYVDQATGKLFKEGDHAGGFVQNLDYEVTQLRTYRD